MFHFPQFHKIKLGRGFRDFRPFSLMPYFELTTYISNCLLLRIRFDFDKKKQILAGAKRPALKVGRSQEARHGTEWRQVLK